MSKQSERYFWGWHESKNGEIFRYSSDSRLKSEYPISGKNCPVEFFSIVAVFAEDCNYNLREFRSDYTRLFIKGWCRGKENELMLRVYEGKLVVARIRFIHQRIGNMTRLYSILKSIRKRYKLDRIKVESVGTEECKSWCIKNGFVVDPCDCKSFIERE